MSLAGELQLQNGEAWVELFELDLTVLGGTVYRFHSGTNEMRQPVVWQGNTYQPLPIQATGFAHDGSGRQPRPKLSAANPAGVFSALAAQYGDFVRAKVTRKRTKVKYLDAVNFPAQRNLLTYTEAFNQWAGGASIARTQDGTIAPDGTTAGVWLLTKTDTGTSRLVNRDIGTPMQTQVTFCVDLRAGSSDRAQFGIYQSSAWRPGSNASILRGPGSIAQVGTLSLCTVTGLSASEWTRVAVTADVLTTSVAGAYIYADTSSSSQIGKSTYVYGPQVEYGAVATDYQPVLGATWSPNPTADPAACLDDDIYYVTRKASEFPVLELELGSPMELPGVMLPRRVIVADTCMWKYRGGECGYAGGAVANEFDIPTTDITLDKCSHTITGCKMRFGATAELPFGGFPGTTKFPSY